MQGEVCETVPYSQIQPNFILGCDTKLFFGTLVQTIRTRASKIKKIYYNDLKVNIAYMINFPNEAFTN